MTAYDKWVAQPPDSWVIQKLELVLTFILDWLSSVDDV